MAEYLFSYGTLQSDKVQLELFGRLLNGTRDRLAGYKLRTIEIRDASFLSTGADKYQLIAVSTNDKGDFIDGTALEVEPAELLTADQYEPQNYKRFLVNLESGKSAWIYGEIK